MLEVNNLFFTFDSGQPPVLQDISLRAGAGEYIAVIGPNGCGKTTLIKQLNALLLPSAGEVLVDGLNTRNRKNLPEIRRRVGMIFQNPDNQIVGMSVEEDVAFGPGNLGLPAEEVRRRVDRALETVGLWGIKTRPPYTLSGGEKQLLALAGLLAMEPKIIALDEPTASLDPAGKMKVMALLQKLKRQGTGIIHVTHNMDEAVVADRVLVMDDGRIAADGGTAEILSRVEWLKSLGLVPPQPTELMWRLQRSGEDVETQIFTTDDAAQAITALLARIRSSNRFRILRKAGGHV